MQPLWSPFGFCVLAGLLSASVSDAYSFLFISSPSTDGIYASRLLTAVEQSRNDKMKSYKLPGVEQIKGPRGLAVDSLRKILYMVDGQGSLYAARLYYSNNGNVACEGPRKLREGLTSLWVAVDFRGKVFVIVDNTMIAIKAQHVQNSLNNDGVYVAPDDSDDNTATTSTGTATTTTAVATTVTTTTVADTDADTDAGGDTGDAAANAATTTMTTTTTVEAKFRGAEILYVGQDVTGVSQPRGIAVDGYKMFWANGENGEQDGTIVQGLEEPLGSSEVTKLTTNLALAHGVCLTSSRIFYTDEEANVFSTKVNGGEPAAVTDKLQKPRGCVFDGDGTVFVADMGDDKVLSFAGAGAELGPRRLSTSLNDVPAPFGLAVLHGNRDDLQKAAASRSASMVLVILAAAVTFFF